ncbi:MAG: hypothetical protein FWD72_03580 [Eggerthellaceae bacterium]|nr:hypothetical protein [Eggerthellaceae bacterium]
MKACISHESAIEYWRIQRALPPGSARRARVSLPSSPPPTEMMVNAGLSLPVHIVLDSADGRWSSKTMKQHVFSGKTPAACFVDRGDGVFVSSPEFSFLQMASEIPLIKLIELGYELCGIYSLPTAGDPEPPERGFYKRKPLTSTKKLDAFIAGMPGSRGRKKALRALRFIANGAASPMETKLSILLTLPYLLGGFGLAMPELNSRIVPTKTAKASSSKTFYACDLYWPGFGLAVEYDSDLQHTGSAKIAEDAKKKNALNLIGVEVITVTKLQLYSSPELEKVAKIIATYLGKRLKFDNPGFSAAHRELRDQLLS